MDVSHDQRFMDALSFASCCNGLGQVHGGKGSGTMCLGRREVPGHLLILATNRWKDNMLYYIGQSQKKCDLTCV